MIRRLSMIALIAICTIPLMGCDKTTFNRVGAGVLSAVRVAQTQIDGMLVQKIITSEKHAALTSKFTGLARETEAYQTKIAAFPKINRSNASIVLSATGDLLRQFQVTLTDPDLVALAPDSKLIATLRWVIAFLEASRGAIEVLFPLQVITPAGATIPSREYRSTEIEFKIPPKPKGL